MLVGHCAEGQIIWWIVTTRFFCNIMEEICSLRSFVVFLNLLRSAGHTMDDWFIIVQFFFFLLVIHNVAETTSLLLSCNWIYLFNISVVFLFFLSLTHIHVIPTLYYSVQHVILVLKKMHKVLNALWWYCQKTWVGGVVHIHKNDKGVKWINWILNHSAHIRKVIFLHIWGLYRSWISEEFTVA